MRSGAVPMLTPEKIKKLTPELADMSEEEILEIRQALYDMAQLAFDVRRYRKGGSKNPIGSFTQPEEGSTIKL